MPSKTRRIGSTPLNVSPLLDQRNVRILRALEHDPRASMSEIARVVGLSSPAVTERLQRLEEAGVIAGYRLLLDPVALGFGVAAFVRIRPAPRQLQHVAQVARDVPEVVECFRITGEDCFLLKVHVGAIQQLEKILDRFQTFGQTTTSIVQSVTVPPRALPISDPAAARS